MQKVFVSYASPDRERVAPFIKGIQAAGFDVWWDVSLQIGDDWTKGIEQALERARCVVIFWSEASVDTPWVRIEAHHAKQKQCIVPVKLDPVEIPDEYRLIQTLNAAAHSEAVLLEKLIASIRLTIDRRARRERLRQVAVVAGIGLLVLGGYLLQRPGTDPTPGALSLASAPATMDSVWSSISDASTLKDLVSAENQLAELATSPPIPSDLHAAHCRLSLRRYELSRRDSDLALAQSQYAQARAQQSDNERFAECEGWLAVATGDPEGAIDSFKRAIQRNKDAVSAYLGLATAYRATGQIDAEEQALSTATVLQPASWRVHNELGLFLQQQGRTDAALSRFQLALELNPGNISVLNNLGVTWLFRADYAQAITAWSQVLDSTPAQDQGATLANIGSAYYLMKDFAAAEIAFGKASRLIGDDYRAWANLADAQMALGKTEAATTSYRRALDRAGMVLSNNPDDKQAHASMITFRSALGEEDWQTALEQLLSSSPGDAELYRLAALAYVRSGEPQAAAAALEQAQGLGYPQFLLLADHELGQVLAP